MAKLAAEFVVDDIPTPMTKDCIRRCLETTRLALGMKRLYDGVFTGNLLDLGGATFVDRYGHDVQTFRKKPVDLIVSANVLCYFGAMGDVLPVFAGRLAAGVTTKSMAQGNYCAGQVSMGAASVRALHSLSGVGAQNSG